MDAVTSSLETYRQLAAVHARVDFGSATSVREGNQAADELRSIAKLLAGEPNTLGRFVELLNDSGPAALWAAHHIVELTTAPKATKLRALGMVERVAAEDTVAAAGDRIWLKEWRPRVAAL